ncbi:hypothetical protein ACFSTA_03055 [Ornithinibacillus salinisoli]|uniref:Uncharacterized protein n=1 Tax=Ornithinibacillus salinisoli TaxID=1848459 RepID=A0ABW4VUK3_9BACI
MKKIKKGFIVMMTAVLILSFFPKASFAQDQSEVTENQITDVLEFTDEQLKQGEKIAPFINIDESTGLFQFDVKAATQSGIDMNLVKENQEMYKKANEYLLENGLASENGTFACSGSNYYDGGLLGGTLYLDSCTANGLAALLVVGAGVAQIANLIPVYGTVAAAVAGGLLTIGSGVILWNNRQGEGVIIKLVKNPIDWDELIPYWVKSQA